MIKTLLIVASLYLCSLPITANESVDKSMKDQWPKRVLITNDNGIDDIKLIKLAQAFAKVADTYVVAPLKNQSGTGHRISINASKPIISEKRNLGNNITAYAVDGYPADCVILGLSAIMREKLPDLVISGINGGANEGDAWLGSGTIGAARIAAYGGFPSIAISGLRTNHKQDIDAIVDWVVRFSSSDAVKNLEHGQFLTVSIPRIKTNEIKGIRFVHRGRASSYLNFKAKQISINKDEWYVSGSEEFPDRSIANSQSTSIGQFDDVETFEQLFVAIVPMRANENDYELLHKLKKIENEIPPLINPKTKNRKKQVQ